MDPLGGLDAITIDCADALALATFWASVFGTELASTEGDEPQYVDLLAGEGIPVLRFQRVPETKASKNRLHLDVAVADLDLASARVEELGGRRISEEVVMEYGYEWLVMADPEGNEFCIVVPPSRVTREPSPPGPADPIASGARRRLRR